MGLWNDKALPHVMDRVLQSPEVNARRAKVCQGLHGRVLEIGFGTGLNLRHYPAEVTEILVVEPSKSALGLAEPRKAAVSVRVEQVGVDGAQLDLPDGSVDCVLSTYTLCTIPAVDAALLEIHRVLRPDGALHFLEHGRAPTESVRRWQRRLHPVHTRIAGGCHMDRPIDDLITRAGLVIRELETGYGDGPRPFSYLYRGRALRSQ
ncbi:MAG TPA: class I SAM-dependent methyltransferase [Propionibacteriaceae bacterium]|nr:class I SAM-dependent methyltransferase [Propionibacteriaceae bacterium]